jgi:hypothetical protein
VNITSSTNFQFVFSSDNSLADLEAQSVSELHVAPFYFTRAVFPTFWPKFSLAAALQLPTSKFTLNTVTAIIFPPPAYQYNPPYRSLRQKTERALRTSFPVFFLFVYFLSQRPFSPSFFPLF